MYPGKNVVVHWGKVMLLFFNKNKMRCDGKAFGVRGDVTTETEKKKDNPKKRNAKREK